MDSRTTHLPPLCAVPALGMDHIKLKPASFASEKRSEEMQPSPGNGNLTQNENESKERSQNLISWLKSLETLLSLLSFMRYLSGLVTACSGPGVPYQRVGSEAVGEHHALTERLVLIILLGQLCRTVNAKASTIHSSGPPVQKGTTKLLREASGQLTRNTHTKMTGRTELIAASAVFPYCPSK